MKRPWLRCNDILAAIEKNDVETAAQIIDRGFDVDSVIKEGKSAISICIEKGVPEIAQLFLERNCSVSLKSPKGDYPLHLAVCKRDVNMVEMLMDHRADATSKNFMGQTPMHIACQLNAFDIIKALVDTDASKGLWFDDKKRTPFLDACKYATKEIIEYLLPKSEVNTWDLDGESPLLECISNPNTSVEMVSLLLKAGANVQWSNENDHTPLFRALQELCICKRPKFNRDFAKTRIQIAMLLIDHKSNLNVKNSIGQTPLHLAVFTGQEILVRKLLNAGSNVDAKDQMSFIPLFYAIRMNSVRIIDTLIQGGSNLASHDWRLARETFPLSLQLIESIMNMCKQVKPLSTLCRTAIRKCFRHSVDADVNVLPVPRTVIKYIKLEE